MDDLFRDFLGIRPLIALVVSIIESIVDTIYTGLLFIASNLVVAADKLLGSWKVFPPPMSWAVTGFLTGLLLHFALIESPKLNRPPIKHTLLSLVCTLIILTPLLGPDTGSMNLDLPGVSYIARTLFGELVVDGNEPAHPPATSESHTAAETKLGSSEKKPGRQNPTEARNNGEGSAKAFDASKHVGRKYICEALRGINLRSAPSGSAKILGLISPGEEVTILERQTSKADSRYLYYKVKSSKGTEGWAYAGDNDDWFGERP